MLSQYVQLCFIITTQPLHREILLGYITTYCSPAFGFGRELYVHTCTFKLFQDLITITKITQALFCSWLNFTINYI